MRKFLILALGMMMITLFSCNPGQKKDGEEEKKDTVAVSKTFNEVVMQDYQYVMNIDTAALFYEVHVELENEISNSANSKIVKMETVAQLGTYCYMINRENPEADSTVTIVEDVWLESFKFDPGEMQITLEQAIDMVKAECEKESVPVPATRFITLRRPVSKEFYQHPFYIFGRMLAKVDAVTGEITLSKRF